MYQDSVSEPESGHGLPRSQGKGVLREHRWWGKFYEEKNQGQTAYRSETIDK